MEYSFSVYARACEINGIIKDGEDQGMITKDHPLYKFRNGRLRWFTELSKKAMDLGSRRLTNEQLLANHRYEPEDAGEFR
jgi:hypothetical protein